MYICRYVNKYIYIYLYISVAGRVVYIAGYNFFAAQFSQVLSLHSHIF